MNKIKEEIQDREAILAHGGSYPMKPEDYKRMTDRIKELKCILTKTLQK